jgi:hypothetical protein
MIESGMYHENMYDDDDDDDDSITRDPPITTAHTM